MNHSLPLKTATSVADLLNVPIGQLTYSQPQLLSLLMKTYMEINPASSQVAQPTIKLIKSTAQEQQRTYVNALVVQAIASIWPNSTAPSNRPIASLNTFLHHILKHSRTTHSTLQLAIFYLFRIRPKVQTCQQHDAYIACGRRMFLAALICAHKFLQDKTYKNSAWSKVSGLDVSEINHAEKLMLQLLDYQLYVKKDTYDQWVTMLQTHLHLPSPHSTANTTTSATLPSSLLTSSINNNNTNHSIHTYLPSPPTSPIVQSTINNNNNNHTTNNNTSLSSSTTLRKSIHTPTSSFPMGMLTPTEDQAPSPIEINRKRKSSLDHTCKKRRC
ncbi:cyclin-domain-containing protein [Cunninghamella echinulata]|nr:cyclin-domain-containing protein [Cunninghamella echinulata]